MHRDPSVNALALDIQDVLFLIQGNASAKLRRRVHEMTISNGIAAGTFVTLSGEPQASSDARYARMARPTFTARLCADGCGGKIAFLLVHPSGNFAQHQLLPRLETRKFASMGTTTRFAGNETELVMERCIQDLGKAVGFLRGRGYERIVLVGHSGGGSLAAFYQAEAEQLSFSTTPDGQPIDIKSEHLPPVDALALLAPHPSRASVLTDWLDPSVLREDDPLSCDPELDMFDPANGPPYSEDFLLRYRAAQVARNRRISDYALSTIRQLDSGADPSGARDRILLVHRTGADPRFTDLTIDPNGRGAKEVAAARQSNYSPISMGRISTLRSWLSQWSLDHSRADGPACLARTSVPVLVCRFGADEIVYPSQTDQYVAAAGARSRSEIIEGANHFLGGQFDLQDQVADLLIAWATDNFEG